MELAQRAVVACELALALQHVDLDRRLVVRSGREDLRLGSRDGRVALDELGHHATERLDPERQRSDVKQHHILDLASEHRALDGGAQRHHLVRIDALVRVLAEDLLGHGLHSGHARRTADEHNLVNLRRLQPRVLERLDARIFRATHQGLDQALKLCTRHRGLVVLGTTLVHRQERQVDVRLLHRRQVDLGLLSSLLEALHGHGILAHIDARLLLELVGDPRHQGLVEVVAAEVRVAVRREHFEDTVTDVEDRDVKRAATKVEHGNLARLLLVETKGQRRGGRLVDDALDGQARDRARILGRLTLAVVEVRRHRDHGTRHLLTQVRFGRLFEVRQHLRADLGRRELLAVDVDLHQLIGTTDDLVGDLGLFAGHFVVTAAHEALDRSDRLRGVGHGLALGRRADEARTIGLERDDRRRSATALRVLDDDGRPAFHHADAGVGRTQIDADDLALLSHGADQESKCVPAGAKSAKCLHRRHLDCNHSLWRGPSAANPAAWRRGPKAPCRIGRKAYSKPYSLILR